MTGLRSLSRVRHFTCFLVSTVVASHSHTNNFFAVSSGQTFKAEVSVTQGEMVRWFFGLNQYDGADAGFAFTIDWVGTEYENWGQKKNMLNYPQMRAPKYPQGLYGEQTAKSHPHRATSMRWCGA